MAGARRQPITVDPSDMAPRRHLSSATPLAAAFAALIVYASLFPFTGWRWPPGQAFATLLELEWPRWGTAFDDWANLIGYAPLGMLVMIAALRGGLSVWAALAIGVVAPAALSYAAEVAQQFLPSRHPSLKDWTLNAAGGAAGALLGAALHAAGLIGRWQSLRERWFVHRSAGALALLALWPLGLLFPAPVPFGLGQFGERLRALALYWLEDVHWAESWYRLLAERGPQPDRLSAAGEALVTGLGLLAPCLVAYAVVEPGWRRAPLALGALALAVATMTLSTLLNFGPQHALAWLTPTVGPALLAAAGAALLLAPVPRRVICGIGLVVLTGLVTLVAQAPADPYFAQSLLGWEQGQFIRFHGLAQWIGWLWPYVAIGWLLGRLGSRE